MVGPKARTAAILSSRLRMDAFICASSSIPAFCADEQRPRLRCDRLPLRNRQKMESAASKHDDRVRNTICPSRDSGSGDPVCAKLVVKLGTQTWELTIVIVRDFLRLPVSRSMKRD